MVGGLVGQPRLGARRGCCSRATTTATCAVGRTPRRPTRPRWRASRSWPPSAPGVRARRAVGLGCRRLARSVDAAGRARVALRPHARLGVAAHLLQRHHRRRPRGRAWRASRRSRSSTTSRAAAHRRSPADDRRALRAVPSLLADMPVRRRGRHARAPRLRGGRLRRDRPRRGARRARSLRRRPGAGSSSATSTRSSRGCAPRSRRRSAAATSRAPRRRASRPARRARLRAPPGRRRRPARPALTLAAIADVLREHLPRRPLALRRTPRRPAAARERARLPHRQHRPRAPARRRALRGRRLQDQLARAARRGR